MDTDDLQSAIDALAAAVGQRGPPDPGAEPPSCELILADIDALLVFIDNLANKLTLALRPPSPAYESAAPVLGELTQHISKLIYAICLLRNDVHGTTFSIHVRRNVNQVIEALRDLAQSFITDDQDTLVKAGTLHELVELARGPSGIPKDNQAAVILSWRSDKDALDDNFHEVANIVQQAESDVDDGWSQIGLHTESLDKAELVRANKVHQILRLTTLLHKRILLDLLPYPSPAPLSAFDALILLSNELLAISDDLVAALYSPQDPDQVRDEVLGLTDVVTRLHAQLVVFIPTADQLTQQLLAISLSDTSPVPTSSSTSKKRVDKRWFDTCVDQILRLCSNLSGAPSAHSVE